MRFRGVEGATTFVDALTARVQTVRFNGRDLDPAEVSDGIRIALPPLAAQNELIVVARCATEHRRGPAPLRRPGRRQAYLYTQLATPDARRMFACSSSPT